MDRILFSTGKVWLAENADNGNPRAKFVLCDFGVNLNNAQLDRATVENWMQSLVNQPLVGKIVKGAFGQSEDFAGHEMRKTYVKDDLGNLVQTVTFDTNAYGTFVDVGIETVDGVECLVGTAEIWNRYPRTVRLIKDRIAAGTLHTSWEIAVLDYTLTDTGVKVIHNGVFTALALLGAKVQPAFESSRLLEVAEADVDNELVSAMKEDMKEFNMENEKIPVVAEAAAAAEEPVISEAEAPVAGEAAEAAQPVAEAAAEKPADGAEADQPAEQPVEASALTVRDLRRRIEEAVAEKLKHRWVYISYMFPEEHMVWVEDEERESELDYILFVYSVEGDEVTVDDGTPVRLTVSIASINETLAQKDAAIAAALTENEALKSQVSELSEIKAKYDKLISEQEKAQAEQEKEKLRAYALSSGLITEGELSKGNAKKLVDALDRAGINQLIADRYMAKLAQAGAEAPKEVETSEARQKPGAVDLTAEEVRPARQNVVRMYIDN